MLIVLLQKWSQPQVDPTLFRIAQEPVKATKNFKKQFGEDIASKANISGREIVNSVDFLNRTFPYVNDKFGLQLWKHFTTRTPADEMGAPATYYDMKVGGQHTRVEKDPRTGRVRLQHQENIITWWDEVPRLLIIIFTIFFVILAVGYIYFAAWNNSLCSSSCIWHIPRFGHILLQLLDSTNSSSGCSSCCGADCLLCFQTMASGKDVEENAVFELVEQITDMVRDSAADGEEYISVPHVRDLIFPPAKRSPTELARWERAVEYINENDQKKRVARKSFREPYRSTFAQHSKEALTKFLKIRDLVASDGSDRVKAEQDFRSKVHPVIPCACCLL
ncbi:unnamed protein product, partial [Mesorhabditis belari]|uniref:Uncharacterized protein n=1 Tax=Mesorhabditis belari TaxID=2138241 RepID=A0AAF3FPV6_9BILA